MPLEIWIPESARAPSRKNFYCGVCHTKFGPLAGQSHEQQITQFARHVKACDKKHPEVVEEALAAREASAFTSIMDKEKFVWKRQREAEGKDSEGWR